MITVHGRADSSNVQKVIWALRELDVRFDRIDRGGRFGGLDDQRFRAISPPGRVPALTDGGISVFESNAILRHLGRAHDDSDHDGGPLWPRDPARLARAEAVMDWAATSLWAAIRPAFLSVAQKREGRESTVVRAQVDAALEHLDVLGVLTENGWMAGEDFTLADIPAGVAMHRLSWIAPHAPLSPAALDWRRRIARRPAFAESVWWPER